MTLSCESYHGHMASLLGGFEKAEATTTHELLLNHSRKKRSSTTVHVKPKRKDGSCEKACSGCGTVKTPLWRLGPSGPKTLCNACGIRYRKKMRKVGTEEAEGSCAVARGKEVGTEVLKERQRRKQEGLWMLLQRSRKFARVCGEEEAEAAALLMAMSSGLFLQS